MSWMTARGRSVRRLARSAADVVLLVMLLVETCVERPEDEPWYWDL